MPEYVKNYLPSIIKSLDAECDNLHCKAEKNHKLKYRVYSIIENGRKRIFTVC